MPRSRKQGPQQKGSSHDFQTSDPMPVEILSRYLSPQFVIWECAAGKGLMSKSFRDLGFEVIETDILTGQDFLMWPPPECGVIVTNPPFDIKNEFLQRAYMLEKPFAFLLPLQSLENTKEVNISRHKLYRTGLQVIFLPRRINFVTPSGEGSGSWFATAWLTNGLNLPKDMIFAEEV